MGSIQGLDTGLGTLLGILLRGYTSRLQEEEDRKQRERQAASLGLTLPQASERSYLSRVLNPSQWQVESQQQRDLMEALQKSVIASQIEQEKQRLIGARQENIARIQASGAMGLAQYKASAGMNLAQYNQAEAMRRLQYSKNTPQALDPSTITMHQASAARSISEALLNSYAADQLKKLGFGGAALNPDPGVVGALGPNNTPTTAPPAPISGPSANAGGYEYGLPALSVGGVTLTPHKTMEREVQETVTTEKARKRAEAQARNAATDEMVNTLERLSTSIHTQTSKPAQLMQSGKAALGNMAGGILPGFGYDKVVAEYQDMAESYLSNIAKTRAMEVGVLTNQDVDRARRAVPSIYDTKEQATFKFAILRMLSHAAEQEEEPLAWRRKIDSIIRQLEDDTITPTGETEDEWIQRKFGNFGR